MREMANRRRPDQIPLPICDMKNLAPLRGSHDVLGATLDDRRPACESWSHKKEEVRHRPEPVTQCLGYVYSG